MASLAEAQPAAGGKKLMLVIGALVGVVLLLAGAVGYLFLAHGNGESKPKAEEAAAAPVAPTFSKIDTFVVNLSDPGTMLQTELQVELGKPGDAELISAYMPRIRSNLILLLSSKTSADVATAEGKARLKAQIRSVINESLADSGHADVVRSVVFTSFIVQLQ